MFVAQHLRVLEVELSIIKRWAKCWTMQNHKTCLVNKIGVMKLEAYRSFEPVKFGMSETEVVNQLGKPASIRTNNENEMEYHYDELIVRYDVNSKHVREGTLLP